MRLEGLRGFWVEEMELVESSYIANKSVCRFRTGIDLGG
jgi:hypothetical protein